jgi:hypothetical protein
MIEIPQFWWRIAPDSGLCGTGFPLTDEPYPMQAGEAVLKREGRGE